MNSGPPIFDEIWSTLCAARVIAKWILDSEQLRYPSQRLGAAAGEWAPWGVGPLFGSRVLVRDAGTRPTRHRVGPVGARSRSCNDADEPENGGGDTQGSHFKQFPGALDTLFRLDDHRFLE